MAGQKITIDLAGAMEKITPEMMDEVRDVLIEGLTKSGSRMRVGLLAIIDMCDKDMTRTEIRAVARDALPK